MNKILLSAAFLIPGMSVLAQNKKPNVLFIAIDDMRPELACYSESQIVSPNIDRIASEGLVFNRAYCQVALCGPSRLSIMTGMHPDRLKNYGMSSSNKIEWRDYRPGITSLPEQFRNHGYYAIGFGKVYDNRLGLDIGYSWDSFTEGWKNKYISPRAQEILAQAEEDIAAGIEPDIIRPAVDYYDTPDESYTDGNNASLAVDFINNYNSDEPYFLAVGFNKPHLPFVAPKKYWDLYERENISLPESDIPPEGISDYMLSPYKEIESYIIKSIIDEDKIRELRHGYYACVSYVDAQIGKIINALEEKGELENTIIILWGDHGFKLGEFGEWAKATNLESDARVPLMVRLPGMVGAGIKTNSPVELVDVLPTVCDAADIPVPDGAEGKSLLSVVCNPDNVIRDFALTQYRRSSKAMGYSIRTNEWRYTEWINTSTNEILDEELYRISDESLLEERNVEDDYPEEVTRLSAILHNYLENAIVYDGSVIP